MSRLRTSELPLGGLKLVSRDRIGDARGFLSRIFCSEELRVTGWDKPPAQINHTYTAHQGTVRGLHFQYPPFAEMKLVTCISGTVWDVAVDIRSGSPTFLRWHAEYLSRDNGRALLIPNGFAHGFQTLTDDVELIYCHSAAYNSASEGGINPNDASLAIAWPLPISQLSLKDSQHPMVGNHFTGILL